MCLRDGRSYLRWMSAAGTVLRCMMRTGGATPHGTNSSRSDSPSSSWIWLSSCGELRTLCNGLIVRRPLGDPDFFALVDASPFTFTPLLLLCASDSVSERLSSPSRLLDVDLLPASPSSSSAIHSCEMKVRRSDARKPVDGGDFTDTACEPGGDASDSTVWRCRAVEGSADCILQHKVK